MAKFYTEDFWGRVRQRMMDLGLNMTDLSRLSGLPYGSIYRQINAGIVPSKHEHLENIASVLGCSVDYLLTGEKKEDNTLSPELMELVTHFKVLEDGQKKMIVQMIDQFTMDNQKYAEVYLQLHPVE
jgi:transcriptional regulator with XRE-family HTH domain